MSEDAKIHWADLKLGAELEAQLTLGPISRTDIVRYQGASGDFQPIHHDEPFAKAAGYDAPLVVGMYPAGVLGTWAAQVLGPERIRSIRFRFQAMVWPGDQLCAKAVVEKLDDERLEGEFHLSLVNQRDEEVISAQITAQFEG